MTSRPAATAALGLAALALLAGCRSSSDGELKTVVADGLAQLHGPQDYERLRGRLLQTLTRLRSVNASPAGRKARLLAIRGFTATLRGVESRIAFVENDSGNLEAATRDTRLADRWLKAGAKLLRAAGRELGVQVGSLNGY